MGLDFFAAAKMVDGNKVEALDTIAKEFPHVVAEYTTPEVWATWNHKTALRALQRQLDDAGRSDLTKRFYGNREGDRMYHTAEGVADMPDNLPNSFLPRIMTLDEALKLADELDNLPNNFIVGETAGYLRFWASRGHCIMCSY